ncbi:MAG: hypothetical protein IJ817_00195 [Clostridia bacterium]|nr:hypothetical protein [Clostridia bacterium]
MNEQSIIKPHLVKPLLEKVVFEKIGLPQQNAMINIKPEDAIDVRKVSEEVVKVTLTRSLDIQPANLMRLSVTMSVDIPVDSIEFGKLPDPKEFIRNSQPVRILVSYVSNMITNLSMNTILGPIVTPPNIQE